ncbi:DinB family protein [Albibacterium sp.]|uniref:DinB family protein n=1 Tax=Albibacterium sp. TaxID=2952885 RepID=UPI002B648E21|nr:DinB family protein [Albibacterium sp.]HUH20210.1 DinB family protein [Albibacterium sp.]
MKDTSLLSYLRAATVREIQGLSVQEFNTIPVGFNNNIIWNVGHLIATEQRILYSKSGQTPLVSEEFFTKYQKGARPEGYTEEVEINEIRKLLTYSIERFEQDRNSNLFTSYVAWSSSYGNTISNIDDAINFLGFHEGLHLGCIKAYKRLLK